MGGSLFCSGCSSSSTSQATVDNSGGCCCCRERLNVNRETRKIALGRNESFPSVFLQMPLLPAERAAPARRMPQASSACSTNRQRVNQISIPSCSIPAPTYGRMNQRASMQTRFDAPATSAPSTKSCSSRWSSCSPYCCCATAPPFSSECRRLVLVSLVISMLVHGLKSHETHKYYKSVDRSKSIQKNHEIYCPYVLTQLGVCFFCLWYGSRSHSAKKERKKKKR
jgi:hypothetical protein